jgi:hypothetical protein
VVVVWSLVLGTTVMSAEELRKPRLFQKLLASFLRQKLWNNIERTEPLTQAPFISSKAFNLISASELYCTVIISGITIAVGERM